MGIDENDSVSIQTVNRKIENFVEIVMAKMVELQKANRDLRNRVKELEKKLGKEKV